MKSIFMSRLMPIFGIMLCLGVFEVQTARADLTDEQLLRYMTALQKAYEDYNKVNLASSKVQAPAVKRNDTFLTSFRIFLLSFDVPTSKLPRFPENLPVPPEIQAMINTVETKVMAEQKWLSKEQEKAYKALKEVLRRYPHGSQTIAEYDTLMHYFHSFVRASGEQPPAFFERLPLPTGVKETTVALLSYQSDSGTSLRQHITNTLVKAGYKSSPFAHISLDLGKTDEESKRVVQSLTPLHRYLYNPSPSSHSAPCTATSCNVSAHRHHAAPYSPSTTPSARNLQAEKDSEDEVRMPTFHEEPPTFHEEK